MLIDKFPERGFKKYVKKPFKIRVIQMDDAFEVPTLEGVMVGGKGDYLMEGVGGELYICKKEIFEKTYVQSDDLDVYLDMKRYLEDLDYADRIVEDNPLFRDIAVELTVKQILPLAEMMERGLNMYQAFERSVFTGAIGKEVKGFFEKCKENIEWARNFVVGVQEQVIKDTEELEKRTQDEKNRKLPKNAPRMSNKERKSFKKWLGKNRDKHPEFNNNWGQNTHGEVMQWNLAVAQFGYVPKEHPSKKAKSPYRRK